MYMPTPRHPGLPQPIRTRYSPVLENTSAQSGDAKGTSEGSMEKASVSGTKARAKVQNKQPLCFRYNNNPLLHFRGRGWMTTAPSECSTTDVLCYVRRTSVRPSSGDSPHRPFIAIRLACVQVSFTLNAHVINDEPIRGRLVAVCTQQHVHLHLQRRSQYINILTD